MIRSHAEYHESKPDPSAKNRWVFTINHLTFSSANLGGDLNFRHRGTEHFFFGCLKIRIKKSDEMNIGSVLFI